MKFLNGWKTYGVAVLTCIYAVSAYFTHHIDLNTMMQLISASGLASGLRHAISTSTPATQ